MSSFDPAAIQSEPSPDLLFRFHVDIRRSLRELWMSRVLIRTLAERDFKARYKQAFLGPAWAVLTPLALLVVFSVFFQRVAKIDTGDVPYPIFSYLGLLPWTVFSSSLSRGSNSLITNKALLNKVYFPREVFPLASVAATGIDFLLSLPALGVLFVAYRIAPRPASVWVLLLIVVLVAFCAGAALLTSALTVYVRDIVSVLPVILQLGLFATPVAYDISKIPASLRTVYCFLNPLAPIVDGFRRAVAYDRPPDWGLLGPAMASTALLLIGSYWLFKRMERGFADVT